MTVLYFAYGSNLWLPRLRHRVPGVEPVGVAHLGGFGLRWHKRSRETLRAVGADADPDTERGRRPPAFLERAVP